jgi:hypothetical protein
MPAPVRIWLLMKKVLRECVNQDPMRAKGTHLVVYIQALALRSRKVQMRALYWMETQVIEALSALAIGAVIELDPYDDIKKVDETDFVDKVEECDSLTELNPDEIPDVDDVIGDVVFRSNSSLPPPRVHLATAECIEGRSGLETVVISVELEAEEVDIPAEEPCGCNDSSTSHQLPVCHEEPGDTVIEWLSKPSEAANALEGRVGLDASYWDSLDNGRANEAKTAVTWFRREYRIRGEYGRLSVF